MLARFPPRFKHPRALAMYIRGACVPREESEADLSRVLPRKTRAVCSSRSKAKNPRETGSEQDTGG